MQDLADIYIEARFGKAAAEDVATDPKGVKAYLTMPQLDKKTLAIRNAIEESVRQERKMLERAKMLAAYARRRIATPDMGLPGKVSDIIRAAIPGLSPVAAMDGIEKAGGLFSYTTPQAEKKYDLAHMLAAGTGAGLGAAGTKLTTAGSEQAIRNLIGAMESAGAKVPETFKDPGQLKQIAQVGALRNVFTRLKSLLPRMKQMPGAASRSELLARAAPKKLGLGGWKGALVGAALVSLPFAIRRWRINRQMRERGGGAAAEAATTAEASITAAKQLQDWRKRQLSQLAEAVGPGAPEWTPPSTPAAPGPAPAAVPTPGPFSQYKLAPFQQ